MTILCPGSLSLYFWDSNNNDNLRSIHATVAVYAGPDVSLCS